MADERIHIRVTSDGAKATRRDIEGLGAGADRASRSLGGLGSALKAAVAGAAVREIVKTADAYTNLSNRLRVITRDEQEMGAVRSELFRISNQTRASVTDLTAVYQRAAMATRVLGMTQRETLEFTESLQHAVALGGSSAQESAAALIQLSQGLGAGALRGEELNSVLEQTPMVAKVIADQLKVNVADLRTLGAEGKITGRDIVDAFKAARAELAEKFGKSVPTVGQSIEVLKNTTTELVGELDSATGASRLLSEGILSIAEGAREALPDLKILISELEKTLGPTMVSAWDAMKSGFEAVFNPHGIGVMRTWSITLAGVSDSIYFASRAFQKLANVATHPLDAMVNPGMLRDAWQALGTDITTATGPRTAALLKQFQEADTIRLGSGFGRAPGTAPPDELGANPPPAFAPMAKPEKGATFASEIAQLQRRNELLRMSNERRQIEGELDQIRSQIKRKLLPQEENEIRALLERNRVQEFVNKSIEDGKKLQEELIEKERERMGQRGIAAGDRAAEIARIGAEEREKARLRTFDGASDQMGKDFLENTRTVGQELAAIFGPGGTLQQGMQGVVGSLSDAIGYSIAFNRSWNDTAEAIQNIGRSIFAEVISALIRIPIQMGINATIASGLRAKEQAEMAANSALVTAQTAATAAASGAAWATPAALANTATLGGAGALAVASTTSAVAEHKALAALGAVGFADGGYTGDLRRGDVAGVVHGKEFVLHADATQRYRGEAEAMNAGTYRPGGGGSVSVTIVDQTDGGTTFETRQLSESEIEVIVRRVAPQAVADDLGSPQSRVGRSLSRNYETKRVRA